MSNGYSGSSGRRALTLVEVIAGLVLLATLLTSVLAAFRMHGTQIRAARERLKADQLVEGLLADWLAHNALPSVGTQRALPDTDGWMWRVLANELPSAGLESLQTVRVEIFRPRAGAEEQVLASVNLVVQGNLVVPK